MGGLAMALAVAAPMAIADERHPFHLPETGDYRLQAIAKADDEGGWPFGPEDGYLACIFAFGAPTVLFAVPRDGRDDLPMRTIPVSTNAVDLVITLVTQPDMLAKLDEMEELVRRMAPFDRLGKRLCDQPPGIVLGRGAL